VLNSYGVRTWKVGEAVGRGWQGWDRLKLGPAACRASVTGAWKGLVSEECHAWSYPGSTGLDLQRPKTGYE
jgi:hypothetical protein